MSRTVKRSITIMELISENSNGMTLNEITEKTGYPRTTVFNILTTLTTENMLQVNNSYPKRYFIGLKAYILGNRYVRSLDLVDCARPFLRELSARLGYTVFLAVRDKDKIIYIDKSQPEDIFYATADIYSRSDVYCTSLGKAILAFESEETLTDILQGINFVSYTAQTITDKERLIQELEITRERGYAIDNRELVGQVMCVGAPVFNRFGKVTAAISAVNLYDQERDVEKEGAHVKDTANKISRQLGYMQ